MDKYKFNKLSKYISTIEDFDKFSSILANRMKNNKSISDNPMIDGLVIGFILTSGSYVRDLFLGYEIERLLDSSIQKLELIIIWILNNEDELCNIISDYQNLETK